MGHNSREPSPHGPVVCPATLRGGGSWAGRLWSGGPVGVLAGVCAAGTGLVL